MVLNRRFGLVLFVHGVTICAAASAAWFIRFDFAMPEIQVLVKVLPILLLVRWATLSLFQLTHAYWRYTGVGDLKDLVKALVAGTIVFFFCIRMGLGIRAVPYSIYLLEMIFSFLFIAGLRVVTSLILEGRTSRRLGQPVTVLIVGAGSAASLLLEALKQTRYSAIGLVDDDPSKQNLKLRGVPVLGRVKDVPTLVRRHLVSEVLIAIPSANGSQMIHVMDACRQSGVPFRAVPSLSSLISGKLQIAELQEINLDELLGRAPVVTEIPKDLDAVSGRVVMVTGAAGSIGSELCRQIVHRSPLKLICLDQAETPLFNLQQHSLAESAVDIVYSVTDITDIKSIEYQLRLHKVDIIFHAAAYKHVPMTEANPYEGLKNNVFGVLDLVESAETCGCEDFVLVSSDKAVKPSSLMGCTKRLGEMIVGARPSRMRCVSVRFGNVLGSQGSVIPLFQEQIRTGGLITVTHPQMTRYFMTIPEASALVLQAASVGTHGDILVLNMGTPVRITDLAMTLTRVMGKREDEVKIVYTGMRPGEKLHEELFYSDEVQVPTLLPKVIRAKSQLMDWSKLRMHLRELRSLNPQQGPDAIRVKIKQIIPEYEWHIAEPPPPIVRSYHLPNPPFAGMASTPNHPSA